MTNIPQLECTRCHLGSYERAKLHELNSVLFIFHFPSFGFSVFAPFRSARLFTIAFANSRRILWSGDPCAVPKRLRRVSRCFVNSASPGIA